MVNKHTPGPWMLDDDDHPDVLAEDGSVICHVKGCQDALTAVNVRTFHIVAPEFKPAVCDECECTVDRCRC